MSVWLTLGLVFRSSNNYFNWLRNLLHSYLYTFRSIVSFCTKVWEVFIWISKLVRPIIALTVFKDFWDGMNSFKLLMFLSFQLGKYRKFSKIR